MFIALCESATLCEKFDVHIGNFGSNNAKGKIINAALISLKFCVVSSIDSQRSAFWLC